LIEGAKEIHRQALERVAYDALRLIAEGFGSTTKLGPIVLMKPELHRNLRRSLLHLEQVEKATGLGAKHPPQSFPGI
jgi:hypothetical protein